jgi:uncharacterized protein YciI
VLFALIANDKPDGKRMDVRPDHLAYLETLGDKLVLAGPFLDAQGNMNGSFVVLETETQAEAESLFAKDPFMLRGVFESIEIRPWKIGVNKTKP